MYCLFHNNNEDISDRPKNGGNIKDRILTYSLFFCLLKQKKLVEGKEKVVIMKYLLKQRK